MPPARRGRGEAGETLVETLVAVAILGIAGVSILGGLMASIVGSDYHRHQATAETLVRAAAEAVKGATYQPCPATYTLPSPGAGFASAITRVEYWSGTTVGNPNAFLPNCVTAGDQGLQRITLTVTAADGRGTETIQVLKRKS